MTGNKHVAISVLENKAEMMDICSAGIFKKKIELLVDVQLVYVGLLAVLYEQGAVLILILDH